MFSDSPRSIPPERAAEIIAAAGPSVPVVVVTHTASGSDLEAIIAQKPSAVQISHDLAVPEDAGVGVWRVIAPGDRLPSDCDAVVIDASHGGGKLYDPEFARWCVAESTVPVILAGGLTPENVREAIEKISPDAVDVASGVEVRAGVKDPGKVRAFVRVCREMTE